MICSSSYISRYRQGRVTRPNAERTATSFSCVADSLKFEFWAKIKKKDESGNFHGDIQSSHLEKRFPGFITDRPYLERIPFSEAAAHETLALEILDVIEAFTTIWAHFKIFKT